MEYTNIKAVIVKENKYNEKDKMLTAITDCMGKISISAKGVSGINSKLSGGIAINSVSEIDLRESGNDIFILTSAKKIISFDNLLKDLEAASYVNYLTSLAADLFLPEEPFPALFKLLVNTIYLIDSKKKDYELLKAVFELRAMAISGYAIDLSSCGFCGKEEIKGINLFEGAGLCSECFESYGGEEISKDISLAINHIISCEDKNVFSFKMGSPAVKELGRLSEEYVKLCMEKEYSSLSYLRKIQKGL